MADTYYIFEDRSDSVATLLKASPDKKVWLEDLCNVVTVLDDQNQGNHRDYLLSYKHKKGGARISVTHSGDLILSAMDNTIVTRVTEAEAMEYQKNRAEKPAEIRSEKPVLA